MTERNTLQKSIVYNALCRMANHPTADSIYETVHTECPSISRATVYRILNRLSEKGTVLKVSVNNGADHFDHQTFPHYHVKCVKCGNVSDVSLPYMEGLEKSAGNDSGYKITGYSIQFDGLCPECASKENSNG